MKRLLLLAGVALWASLQACAPAAREEVVVEEPPSVDDALMDELTAAWDVALNSGESAQTVALYADGATMMPPEASAMRGKEAIGSFVEQLHASGTLTVSDAWTAYHFDEAMIAADGTWTLDVAPAEGDMVQDSGRWMAMWARQEDGSWKMVRNIWNSDRLPEGMAPPPGHGAAPAAAVPEPAEPICPEDPAGADAAFVSTFVEGDLAANVAVHAENGVRHPPHMESVVGRAALTSFIGAYLDAFEPRELALGDVGSYVSDDWGASWGNFSFDYTLRDGSGGVTGSGKYLSISTRDDEGCWREETVLWNSDSPPA